MSKITNKMRLCVLFLMITIVWGLCSYPQCVHAAGGVTVDLSFQEPSAQAGEIVTLDVTFSSFPSITRFGPIEIYYDSAYLEFVDATIGQKLEGFALSWETTEDNSMIKLSAINEAAEEEILKSSTNTEADTDEALVRNSNKRVVFSSEEPVVVAQVRFRISDEARGEVKAWLGSLSGFRDSNLENVVAGAGASGSLIVQAVTSSDATLASLAIDSFELTPAFDPGIFEYNLVVSKNTTDVAVNAVPFNLNSSVEVVGEADLQMGDNVVTITVKAEDGEAILVYTVTIYRSDSISVNGLQIVDRDNVAYDLIALPDTLVIPANFVQSTCLIDGKEVPCFRKDGVLSVLVYVKKDGEQPTLYVFNQDTGTMRPYEPGKMLLRSSLILTVVDVPANVMIPEGFTPTKITYGSTEIDGYKSKDGKTSIAYLKNEDGVARFYVIDSQNGDFYPYQNPAVSQNLFLYLFIVCASIAVVEAAIIGILFYRRRIQFRRQAKPRRV